MFQKWLVTILVSVPLLLLVFCYHIYCPTHSHYYNHIYPLYTVYPVTVTINTCPNNAPIPKSKHNTPTQTTMTTTSTTTKPRSDSTSSRNDLFNTSWATEVRPPRPLALPPPPLPPSPRIPASSSTLPRLRQDIDIGFASSISTPVTPSVPSPQASRTSSFFDKPTELPIPPLNLGRSSSLRNRPPPLPLDTGSSNYISSKPPTPRPIDTEPLSPLHQSPSLPAIADWNPPRPPCSDDISLRLTQRSMYLLGEGRYATVYLASYKKDVKGKGRSRNPYLPHGPSVRVTESTPKQDDGEEEMEVNEEGDGFVGGSWRLCAAKRMAPDRQSQTMGLREAFFLNRLAATVTSPIDGLPALMRGGGYQSRRTRAVSPLRDGSRRESGTPSNRNGSVYVVKLVAVKEDIPPRTTAGHGRSVSDAVQEGSRGTIVRQRSSTMMNRLHQNQIPSRKNDEQSISSLNSHPSLPSLAKAAKSEIETAPALSRLVLILEHAPLGTMDRFLRTSPGLVGKKMWNRWAVQTTDALSWVHGKGIVHADIKAGNLLVRLLLNLF
jgi:hypothetical protein